MESQDNPEDEAKSAAKDGPTRIDPRVGSTLADRYRIHSLLGEGGMGKVYAGEHVLMRKRVAIKVLHKELTNLTDVVRRFEREAMAAANIDHPNVAGATDFGKLPTDPCFWCSNTSKGYPFVQRLRTVRLVLCVRYTWQGKSRRHLQAPTCAASCIAI